MQVSTLILTYNEEANLPACLQALAWCDDIVVVDSGSTDRTVEIAERGGARVVRHPFESFAAQRNFGLDAMRFRHDWVLHLDADEVVTRAFRSALERLPVEAEVDGYLIPSKTMLFGRWLRHAGMYPTYQVRLGHVQRLRFKQVGHGQREACPASRVRVFPEPYLHFSFSHGLRRWLEKHVRYARDEAELLLTRPAIDEGGSADNATARRRRAKMLAARLPLWLRPLARFTYVYLWRQGFRDGRPGLAYALMLAVYEGMIAVLAYEARLGVMGGAAIPETAGE